MHLGGGFKYTEGNLFEYIFLCDRAYEVRGTKILSYLYAGHAKTPDSFVWPYEGSNTYRWLIIAIKKTMNTPNEQHSLFKSIHKYALLAIILRLQIRFSFR